jgi:hypothetical protein
LPVLAIFPFFFAVSKMPFVEKTLLEKLPLKNTI